MSAGRLAAPTVTQTKSPQFGLMPMLQPASFFQLTTENFVWNFFLQDVIALWIPRVINSLRRGRIPYDPQEDPSIREKKPLEQLLHSLYMNTKGLNYKNGVEETLREVETGPGIFIVPAVMFAIGSALMLGRLGVVLSSSDLKTYHTALMETMKSQALRKTGYFSSSVKLDQANQKMIQTFLDNLLMKGKGHFTKQNGLNRIIGIKPSLALPKSDQALVAFLQSLPGGKARLNQLTYGEALTAWIERWSKMSPKKGKMFDTEFVKQTQQMRTIFSRIAFYFNEKVLRFKNPAKLHDITLNLPKGAHHATTSVEHFMECMRKFKPYAEDITQVARKNLKGVSGTPNIRNVFYKAAEKVLTSTRSSKLILSLSSLLLTGFTLLWISSIAQRGKTYEANRTVRLDGMAPEGPAKQPKFAGSLPSHLAQKILSRQLRQSTQTSTAVSFFDAGKEVSA